MTNLAISNQERLIRLAKLQNDKCVFCKVLMELPSTLHRLGPTSMTREHIIPRAHDGEDDDENCAVSCNRCNALRGTIHMELFQAIVQNLFAEDGFREHWHTNHSLVFKLLRKAVALEVMRAYAYVCRHTAYAYVERIERYQARAWT